MEMRSVIGRQPFCRFAPVCNNAEQFHPLAGLGALLLQPVQGAAALPPGGKIRLHPGQQPLVLLVPGGVQKAQMALFVHQGLMLVLAVNIHEQRGKRLVLGQGHQRPVHPAGGPARQRDFPGGDAASPFDDDDFFFDEIYDDEDDDDDNYGYPPEKKKPRKKKAMNGRNNQKKKKKKKR